MPEPITFAFGNDSLPLRLTMRRAALIHDLTGIDLFDTSDAGRARLNDLGNPKHLARVLFALAGGEDSVGCSVTAFEDELTPGEVAAGAAAMQAVFERDVRQDGGSGNAPPAPSRSRT